MPVVALWQPGTSTALDASVIVKGRDVGAAGAFVATLDGAPITFTERRGSIYDLRTGSRWNAAGGGVAGPLKGARLQPIVSGGHFWFAWSVFKPYVCLVSMLDRHHRNVVAACRITRSESRCGSRPRRNHQRGDGHCPSPLPSSPKTDESAEDDLVLPQARPFAVGAAPSWSSRSRYASTSRSASCAAASFVASRSPGNT